jgi:hypothetical protein
MGDDAAVVEEREQSEQSTGGDHSDANRSRHADKYIPGPAKHAGHPSWPAGWPLDR